MCHFFHNTLLHFQLLLYVEGVIYITTDHGISCYCSSLLVIISITGFILLNFQLLSLVQTILFVGFMG